MSLYLAKLYINFIVSSFLLGVAEQKSTIYWDKKEINSDENEKTTRKKQLI